MNTKLPSNLEFETFEIKVKEQGELVKVNESTAVEHSKIIGIFGLLKGGTQANFLSTMIISVNGENLISHKNFHASIIEKTNSLSVLDSMWIVDKEINNSDIRIEYKDGSEINDPYSFNLYFVCEKRQK